jgi:hypothetical protein
MIEAARKKLRQAQFFYRRLVSERDRTVRTLMNEREAFGYYFSAFLMTARNVPWAMQKEEPEKYRAWNPTWKQADDRGTQAIEADE